MDIDIAGLVDDGVVNLDDIMEGGSPDIHESVRTIYTRHWEGLLATDIVIQRACAYGITAYRWAEVDDSIGVVDTGPWRLDQSVAHDDAVAREDDDDTPDIAALLDEIAALDWWSTPLSVDDARRLVDTIAGRSTGGQVIIDRAGRAEWTTRGAYVEGEAVYVSIPDVIGRPLSDAQAAEAIIALVRGDDSE